MDVQSVKRFFLSLKQDIARLDQLSQQLDQQHLLMSQRKADVLDQLNQQALGVMTELQQSHRQRSRLLAQFGFHHSPESLQRFLQTLPEKARQNTETVLKELTYKASLCHAKNEKNGLLLSSQRQVVQKLMGQQTQTEYPAHLSL